MLSHYKHSRDSDKRDAKTKAPAAYIMSFTCSHIDQHSCDSDEKAPDRHKTKDLTTTTTPAAATRPTTSEQYFVHATGARPHQLNADTPIFDFCGTDQAFSVRIAMYAPRTHYANDDLFCWCFILRPRIRCAFTRVHISYGPLVHLGRFGHLYMDMAMLCVFFSFGAISVELECLHDLLGILFTFIIVSI